MKIPEKSKEKKERTRKQQNIMPKKEHVLIVAQEFKFARLLSGNEKKTRDRVLKTLKKWLRNCFQKGYEFKEDDFVRVWKGLFYAVWMSDKPLIQEELCENIAAVLDLFPPEHLRHALLMYQAGLRVLASEWYGLDQHRTDKFLMLVRRYLRASLRCLARQQWSLKSCQMYAKALSDSNGIFALKTPHFARNALSMLLHVVDCYLEEIAKVSGGSIPGASLAELLRPLLRYMCAGDSPALCVAARRLLTSLLRQSELGLRYAHATAAWQQMGCPVGGPEALELVSDDEDDDQQNGDEVTDDEDDSAPKPLDPRAGRVNVELPCLPVPAAELAELMRGLLPTAASARHRRLRMCLERFEQLSRDEYPLRVQTHEDDEEPSPPARVRRNRSAAALHALEKKLVANSDELALRGLGRKHRKRLLAKSRAGASIVEENLTVRQKLSTKAANGDWQVEPTEPEAKKQKLTPIKNEKKRKNNATDAGDKKRRKSENNFKETAHDRQKIADKSPVVDKLENNNLKQVQNGKLEKKNTDTKNLKNKKVKTQNVKNVTEKKNNIIKKPIVTTNVKLGREKSKIVKQPTVVVNKIKAFQKQTNKIENSDKNNHFDTPKKVKFALKNNSMQQPFEYYKSVRQSPNIPYDGSKQPNKTNLKPSTPSPINPFFKKKLKQRK